MPPRQAPVAVPQVAGTVVKPKKPRKTGHPHKGDALKYPSPREIAAASPPKTVPASPTLSSPSDPPTELALSPPPQSSVHGQIANPPQSSENDYHHNSEVEFSRLLDYYGIEWRYEPRQFPLQWRDGRPTEMFTPDFYLPEFDLYIELTTMRQSLVRRKNRKLRLLRALYPEINIKLLYRRDYQRILERFSIRPDSPTIGSDGMVNLLSPRSSNDE